MSKATRHRTADLAIAPPGGGAVAHTAEQIGPKRRMLTNGSLLCLDVPIARTGWMAYGPGETPIKPSERGVAWVERTHDALFNEHTMGTMVAIAVTDGHPADDVTPANWERLSKGYAMNVRRGTGDDADVVLADLVITDAGLITAINADKREVSLGYDADYYDTSPGLGQQRGIVANHVALVERGRCGPRCAIGDHAPTLQQPIKETRKMPATNKPRVRKTLDAAALEALHTQRATIDAEIAEAEAASDEGGDNAVHVHLHGGPQRTGDEARLTALESGVSELKGLLTDIAKAVKTLDGKKVEEPEDEDELTDEEKAEKARLKKEKEDAEKGKPKKDKTGDSATLGDFFKRVAADAEILVPGIRVPTFDAAAPRATTNDSMCKLRRRVLDHMMTTNDGAAFVGELAGDPAVCLDDLDCTAVATIFRGAAQVRSAGNNARSTTGDGVAAVVIDVQPPKGPPSAADYNKAAETYWAGKTASLTTIPR